MIKFTALKVIVMMVVCKKLKNRTNQFSKIFGSVPKFVLPRACVVIVCFEVDNKPESLVCEPPNEDVRALMGGIL